MSAPHRTDYPALWKAQAKELDRGGYFNLYPADQYAEILRKGYLGSWSPEQSLSIARKAVSKGTHITTQKFRDEIVAHFDILPNDEAGFLLALLDEVPPQFYRAPRELQDPPGCPFVFHSARLGRMLYFKLQVFGTPNRPRVVFWSCHPPLH
ncbi:MAG: hypothetical protein C0504_20245 [Candidatus Solibacter sp.]|nr:hypothetical protein [Candidatus Solibacter sp.]